MLIVTFQRDADSPLDKRNYSYGVYINTNKIAQGRIEGHDPKEGWQGLVKDLAESCENCDHVDETELKIKQLAEVLLERRWGK
jgi:hypothetical protein